MLWYWVVDYEYSINKKKCLLLIFYLWKKNKPQLFFTKIISNKPMKGSINEQVKMTENHADISYDSDMIYVPVLSKAPYESDEYLPPCPRSNFPLLCLRGWVKQPTILVETEDNDRKKQDSSHSNVVEFEVEAHEYEAPLKKRFHFKDDCCLPFHS